MDSYLFAFERLKNIMDELRDNCPWDKKQTILSLRNLTIEETYELTDAITRNDWPNIKEELGDLLLHVLFYSKIADEQQEFDLAEMMNTQAEKLIRRHPHIYGDLTVADEAEVKQNWEKIKMQEGKKSVLGGVPAGLPAMIKALRMQDKAAQVGFQWDNTADVWEKLSEEITELESAMNEGAIAQKEEEFGDVLFSLINLARYLNIDPENALEKVNQKFKSRFQYIESHASKKLEDMSLLEMDQLWDEAKNKEKE